MNRFVVIADLHCHPWSAFSKGDGLKNSRLRHSLDIFEDSLKYARDESIPWLFAGDLVHTAGYALNTVLAGITDILACYPGVEKVVVWGNHDARGVGGKITLDQTVFAALARTIPMTVLDPTVVPIVEVGASALKGQKGITIAGAGYQPRPNLLEFAPPADVGIYHQTVRGSMAPNGFIFGEGIEAGELLERYRLSIVGHVHHPQQIDAPKGQGILIPGSPEHQSFGDRDVHGWWVVTMPEEKEGNPILDFIPGGSPEFRTVDTPDEVQVDGNFYRVRVVPQGATLPEGVIAVAPIPTTVEHRDALHGVVETEQVLQVWLKAEPPDDDVAKYLSVGRELLVSQDPTRLRNVQLTRLQLHNFCCFADQELLVRQGLWLITGSGKDYPSNGAGKSSLAGEALYWLIFGKTTKGLGADEVIRWGTTECTVTAEFADGDETLTVNRQRGPNGHTLFVSQRSSSASDDPADWEDLEVWAAPSVNEMTAKLGRYLGLTPEIFQNLAYFSQEKLLLFSSATDGERKNVLADLIGLSAYQQASSAANARVIEYEREQVKCETRSEMLSEQFSQLEDASRECVTRLQEWDKEHATASSAAEQDFVRLHCDIADVELETSDRLARIEARAAALTQHYGDTLHLNRAAMETEVRAAVADILADKLEELNQRLRTSQIRATQGFDSVKDAQQALNGLKEQQWAIKEQKDLCTTLHDGLNRAQNGLIIARGERRALTDKIAKNASELEQAEAALSVGVCPTCRQPVTEEHRVLCLLPLQQQRDGLDQDSLNKDTDIIESQHDCERRQSQHGEAIAHLQELQVLIDRLGQVESDLREMASCEREIDSLRNSAAPEQLIQQRVDDQIALALATYNQKQDRRVDRAKRCIQLMVEESRHKASVAKEVADRLAGEKNPHGEELQNAMNRLTDVRLQIGEVEEAAQLMQSGIAVYDYWRMGFSKQGLQSLLVEEIAVLFNANRSDVFPLLTQGVYDVQFSTLSKTRAGELREKTEFLVYEHGKLVPYGTLSGGQRRRVDIGIMLVLTQAVAQWMGTPGVLGLLILDEVFGFLDASGAEGLLMALNQLVEVVPTIYVITHDTNLQALVPNVLHVEQDKGGISRLA